MKNLLQNRYLNTLIYPLFFIFGYLIAKEMNYTMFDDGWRHLAMAFHQDQIGSWGELFIHSLYKEYDPWFMWHYLLRVVAYISSQDKVHIVINGFIYGCLSSWFYIVFKRYSQLNYIIIILLSFILPILNYRYFFLRPDVLSGLFLLYFMLIKKRSLMTILTLVYMPFYYVFWFYLGYIGILKLFLRKYKDLIFLIVLCLIGFVFHLLSDFNGFIDITKNVLNNDTLLNGQSVGESKPLFIPLAIKNYLGTSILLIILLIFSYLFYSVFKPKDRILELLILFMPLIILQARFYALLFPLILVYIFILIDKFYNLVYEKDLAYTINYIINLIKNRSYFGNISKKNLKIIFIVPICIILFFIFLNKIISYKEFNNEISDMNFMFEKNFENKKILFTTMQTPLYISIYKKSSSKYLPSCSLGWVDYKNEKLKNIYFKMIVNSKKLTTNEFFEFVKFNNIDIFIIDKNSNNLKINNQSVIKNGYKFYKLYKNNIIFIKK